MSKLDHFVDYVRLSVKAGDGGEGAVNFLREKYVEFGGPAGGDGGRGGSIFLVADENLTTLLDLKMRPSWMANNGRPGGSKNCSGRSGADLSLSVPLGTVATDARTGELIGELTRPGQTLMVARGGKGGLGNQHFATPTNKAPRKTIPAEGGEQKTVILELKILADAGFVGLPNAGKSTLLSRMTSANPKIAPYPFTTLSPNLGVYLASDFQSRITLADIPGLIEGAHNGAGLGDRFLRHIERTHVLVQLVAPEAGEDEEGEATTADASTETLLYAYHLVDEELRQYSMALAMRPRIVCLTKLDLLTQEEIEAAVAAFAAEGIELLPICAVDGQHLEELKLRIEAVVMASRQLEIPITPPAATDRVQEPRGDDDEESDEEADASILDAAERQDDDDTGPEDDEP